MDLHLMKNEFLLPDQPRSQGSLLPALPRAGRREPCMGTRLATDRELFNRKLSCCSGCARKLIIIGTSTHKTNFTG